MSRGRPKQKQVKFMRAMPGVDFRLLKRASAHAPSYCDAPPSIAVGGMRRLPWKFDDGELLGAVNEAFLKDSQARAGLDEQKHIMQRLDSLTTREHEVLSYLITGMLNKQIAYELNISERTVKAHRKHVLDKMGVDSIAELVRLTEKAGVKPEMSPINFSISFQR